MRNALPAECGSPFVWSWESDPECRFLFCCIGAKTLLGCEPGELLTTRYAHDRGLGEMDLNQIEVVGVAVDSVRRRFKRVADDDRIIHEDVNILHAEGTCTGCKVAIMSSLFDMKNKGILDQAKGFTLITGKVELPYGFPAERLVAVGACVPKEKRGKSWVKGCPPNNVYTIEAITGSRQKDTYASPSDARGPQP